MKKTLIIAPHPDDEVLWCSSVLNKDATVIVVTDGDKPEITRLAQTLTDFELIELHHTQLRCYENKMGIIKDIEDVVTQKYKDVFIPSNMQHQDHITVHEASRVIFRPKQNLCENLYEYPYWGYDVFHENCVKRVNPNKDNILKACDLFEWNKYVLSYNQYIGAKYGLDGYYEPFKLVRGILE